MEYILIVVVIFLLFVNLRDSIVNSFKIGYYESKLKHRDVDISHIENITLIEILKKD